MNPATSLSVIDIVKSLETRAEAAEKALDAIRALLATPGKATTPRLTAIVHPKAPKKATAKPKAEPKAVGPGASRGRGRPPKFDQAQSLELARKHADGTSINQLAHEMNATRQAVKHAIDRVAAGLANTNGASA